MRPTFYRRIGKRWFDAGVSLTGLVLLSPLLAIIALAVRLSSPGPALFSQVRSGRLGKPFRILKFRTMRVGVSGSNLLLTATGDSRITPLGHWLRKTKLDELPQLFNVVAGHMSLVGPRPEVPVYVAKYSSRQRAILLVRPGITSPGIDFDEEDVLAGSVDKEEMYLTTVLPAKLDGELAYCANIGLLEDQRVILQTIAGVAGRMVGGAVRGQGGKIAKPPFREEVLKTKESCSPTESA
jgi:lipopolysaccharide/colanic/teichoic acid biosynthesis glycosyltransferase